jgi:hypothetical protein
MLLGEQDDHRGEQRRIERGVEREDEELQTSGRWLGQ